MKFNGWAMISAAQKSSGFPAKREAKIFGFVFSFFVQSEIPKIWRHSENTQTIAFKT
ncbi:hypothetical protein [Maribacter aestuarii]|uniref:hypothetical protein n=1 Tax=Maribacter aestuarii TaxID=1130723 RepID=UPI00248D056D|nr:hypothetical protein [Maribacter aestuarii]